jgi:uncharacterized membrane protein
VNWKATLGVATVLMLAGATPGLGAASAETRPLLERLWYAQGHTHPIVVHFPIALLIVAGVASVLRPFNKRVTVGMVYFCLLLGSAGAVLSCLAGWAWAPQEKPGYLDAFDAKSPIFWHRWGGVALTVVSVGILVWATLQLRRPTARQWPWQAACVALALGMGWVGHEGGELVYADNAAKIFEIASGERPVEIKETRKVIATTPPLTAPGTKAIPSGSFFASKVWPIFEAKCVYCHDAEHDKGGFRMHTEEIALQGGDSGHPLYVKGNSKESALFKHIRGEEDFELMPPKKEKKPITPEELAILMKWVDDGASWTK